MKKAIILLFIFCSLIVSAQKKASSVALHYGFTDFRTAMNIKTSSLGSVLKNGQWSNFPAMDAGYGISYWQGLNRRLDLSANMNFTKSIFTFPAGTYTSTKKIFTAEVLGLFKFLPEDQFSVTPYISAGAGLYSNAGKVGFYVPAGVGIHANLWEEAFVFAGADYRITLKNTDNKAFFYKVGVGTHLFRRKEKAPEPIPAPIVVPEPKIISKNVAIWVKDEATSLPLPNVEVNLTAADGKTYSGKSDEDGKLNINSVEQNNYDVSGVLHGIVTQSKKLESTLFDESGATINIILLHNDPRFTLSGKAVNKTNNAPIGGVMVSVNNSTQATVQTTQSSDGDGRFTIQLEPASDFSISGKKEGYFSNIEQVSTKGLNRSTTLYVKLELAIQEAKQGQQIVLKNIYFETNKADLNTTASTDLQVLIKYLQDNPLARIEIQGHTDSKGSKALNDRLSKNRALSVLNYLVSKGIDRQRLVANGYGSSRPVDNNATAEGRANNRRVEIRIL